MEARIIEDREFVKGPLCLPLTGPEFLQQIKAEVSRVLDGEHGLFNIGRAWPRASFRFVLTLQGLHENAITVEVVKGSGGDPVVAALVGEGTTEPPDAIREGLGIPVQRAAEAPVEEEFGSAGTAVAKIAKAPEPIRIKRGK